MTKPVAGARASAAGGASPAPPDVGASEREGVRAAGGSALEGRCYLSVLDFQPADLEHNLALAGALKRDRHLGREAATSAALEGTYLALLFEKPSLRTRSTFEIAIRELGGDFIDPDADVALGKRESLADVGRSLERWVAGAVVRTYAQRRLQDLALATTDFRVINALSDEEHPCQALADCLTLKERWGDTRGRTVAFVGDGGNVATSFAQAAAMLGITVHIASPEGFELPASVDAGVADAACGGAELRRFHDPVAAVRDVDAVYTDVWTSMGREAEVALRRCLFGPYQVNDALMAHAKPDACFLHCLPAHRGEEVTDSVMDSAASVVFDQAENRLHTQKALLLMLFED
ncbi:MAG: ornithine carbamoyltransferase [Acidobacteria bacterium]|nr:ornithine carbamoyltransferase [Acidobacteriota bacterium]